MDHFRVFNNKNTPKVVIPSGYSYKGGFDARTYPRVEVTRED